MRLQGFAESLAVDSSDLSSLLASSSDATLFLAASKPTIIESERKRHLLPGVAAQWIDRFRARKAPEMEKILTVVVSRVRHLAKLDDVSSVARRIKAHKRILHAQPGIIGISQNRALLVQDGQSG